jgi:hypothetical protein
MSSKAAHESGAVRRLCQACRERKALFRFRGRVRADRDHTLCFQCFRAERDRRRAAWLAAVPRPTVMAARSPGLSLVEGRRPSLTDAQISHRWRMLGHLRTTRP